MKRFSLLPLLTAAAIVPTAALAQVTYDSNIGTGSGFVGDDAIYSFGPLGFTFVFPDGVGVTALDMDSNGRILPPGGDSSDFSPSVGEFLAETSSLCPWFDDLTPDNGEIFVSTSATQTNITYQDVGLFGSAADFSFQVQLHSDGRIGFIYDQRTPADNPIVGLSEGNGAADPGSSDLSAALATAGVTTVYEEFSTSDLADLAIEFTPDGSGGWTTIVGPSGFPLPPIPGTAEEIGKPINRTLDFNPNGAGGYNVLRSIPRWLDDTGIGTDLGAGDDSLSAAIPLGFTFTMPSGSGVTAVYVDSNGRVLGDTVDGSDFSPSLAELLTGANSSLCPMWVDLSPNIAGTVSSYVDPGGKFAAITWRDVPQFGETNAHTFQAVLRANSSFSFNYVDTSEYADSTTFVGCSSGADGAGSDPGESNYADLVNSSNAEGTVYETWTGGEQVDVQPILSNVGVPELGGTMDVLAEGISSDFFLPTLLFGFWNTERDPLGVPGSTASINPDLPLDIIGIEGGVLSTSADLSFVLPVAANEASFSLALANDPGIIGIIEFYLQFAYIGANDTTFGLGLTNTVKIAF